MHEKILSTLVFTLVFLQGVFAHTPGFKPVKTFVIVHGAWQAPWAWERVKELLESKGQQVVLVELPAHGMDSVAAKNITLNNYEDRVIGIIRSRKEKVVLVGHGIGGIIITAVAQKMPSKIEKLIYLGAFVPANGQSLLDLLGSDKESLVTSVAKEVDSTQTLDIMRKLLIDIFCADCSADQQQELLENFKDEPALPFKTKVFIDPDVFAKFDTYYIKTLEDQAISPALQDQMIAAAGITKVYPLQSSHSPFLSMPASVATVLLDIIKYKIDLSAFHK